MKAGKPRLDYAQSNDNGYAIYSGPYGRAFTELLTYFPSQWESLTVLLALANTITVRLHCCQRVI
jgi:hypothetical protein